MPPAIPPIAPLDRPLLAGAGVEVSLVEGGPVLVAEVGAAV